VAEYLSTISTSLAYRRMLTSDLPLIYGTFADSYRGAHAAGPLPMHLWPKAAAGVIDWWLSRWCTRVVVACHPAETDTMEDVYGWLIHDVGYTAKGASMPYVNYLYIKEKYRKKYGIARGLFAAAEIDPSEPFAYACKTGILGKYKAAVPMAKWQPQYHKYPAPQDPTPAERPQDGDKEDDPSPQDSRDQA